MFSEFYPRMKTGSDMTKPFSYMTNMDLVETGSDYKIITDIPGVEPSELKVWLDDFDLCIKANCVHSTRVVRDLSRALSPRSTTTIYHMVKSNVT